MRRPTMCGAALRDFGALHERLVPGFVVVADTVSVDACVLPRGDHDLGARPTRRRVAERGCRAEQAFATTTCGNSVAR